MLDHLRDVEMSEESTRYWSLLDGRYLATYAAERRQAPLRGQGSRLLRPWRRCVERPENRRYRPPPINLQRSRQPAGNRNVELNAPSEPEYVL
jgi:hypothetical protein